MKSHKAAALIRLAVEDGPLIQIKGLKDAIDIWDRLKELYEPKGFSSEFLLCKELLLLLYPDAATQLRHI